MKATAYTRYGRIVKKLEWIENSRTCSLRPERVQEYLAAENRILKAQIKVRLLLSKEEKAISAEISHRLGLRTRSASTTNSSRKVLIS